MTAISEALSDENRLEISNARLAELIAGLNVWTAAGRSHQPEIDMDLCCALMELQRLREQSLRSGNGGEVRVKALEWQGSGWPKVANFPLGQYQIWSDFEVFRDGHILQTDGLSYESAKAAAFADYSQRILSALDIKP